MDSVSAGADRISCVVKWYDPVRGFGFLLTDDGKDVFVHASEVTKAGIRNALQPKQRVSCRIGTPPQGRSKNDKCAVDLKIAA